MHVGYPRTSPYHVPATVTVLHQIASFLSPHPNARRSDFNGLQTWVEKYDQRREQVIQISRKIEKSSKQAIFSLHRNDGAEAAARLKAAEAAIEELLPTVRETPALRYGSFSRAMEEYAEAVVFRGYLEERRLVPSSAVRHAEPEEYLGGVLDFTGELNRFAVLRATERDVAEVRRARDLVEAIFAAFIQFDLRNGALRKKYDALKYCLRKLENTLYELSLTAAGLPVTLGGDRDKEPDAKETAAEES